MFALYALGKPAAKNDSLEGLTLTEQNHAVARHCAQCLVTHPHKKLTSVGFLLSAERHCGVQNTVGVVAGADTPLGFRSESSRGKSLDYEC